MADTWGTSWNGCWALSWARTVTPPAPVEEPEGPFMGRKKKRKKLASSPPLLVPALPNDDDEVLEQVLSLFMKGLQ